MQLKNAENTEAVLTRLESVYDYMLKKPDDELNAFNEAFALVVDDLDPQAVQAAAMQWLVSSSPFMPKPGELRQIAIDLQRKAIGGIALPDVAQAWVQARKYCAAWMQYREMDSNQGSTGYHEIIDGELRKVSFEQSSLYPKSLHAAIVDACKTLGITRIFYCDPMDTMAEGTLFAQFKATYGTVQERVEKQNEIMHPMVAGAMSGVVAGIRARAEKLQLSEASDERR